jgi:hypothetical protein
MRGCWFSYGGRGGVCKDLALRKSGVCGKGKACVVVLERSARCRGRWKIEACIFVV